MAYINLCLHVYIWWLNMCVLLRAVTCPVFSSNGMHAVIIIFISIVLTLLLFTLSRSLFCSLLSEKKIHDINTQANFLLKFWKCDLNIFCRNFFQRNVSHMILIIYKSWGKWSSCICSVIYSNYVTFISIWFSSMPKETFNFNKSCFIRNITPPFLFEIKMIAVFPCLNKYKFTRLI